MKKRKVHKWKLTITPERWSVCGQYDRNEYSLDCKNLMAAYWENVTCKRCLRKRGLK